MYIFRLEKKNKNRTFALKTSTVLTLNFVLINQYVFDISVFFVISVFLIYFTFSGYFFGAAHFPRIFFFKIYSFKSIDYFLELSKKYLEIPKIPEMSTENRKTPKNLNTTRKS